MSNARQLAASATSLTDLSDNSISGAFDVGSLTIGGTEVIDSSRNLSNIAGGFKTVNGTSVVGSGDISAGASTTYGAVGTYMFALNPSGSQVVNGGTVSGSTIRPANSNGYYNSSLSGTWRVMGATGYTSSGGVSATTAYSRTVYMRIS